MRKLIKFLAKNEIYMQITPGKSEPIMMSFYLTKDNYLETDLKKTGTTVNDIGEFQPMFRYSYYLGNVLTSLDKLKNEKAFENECINFLEKRLKEIKE